MQSVGIKSKDEAHRERFASSEVHSDQFWLGELRTAQMMASNV